MSVHGSATADQHIYFDGMHIGQNLTGTGSQANGTAVNDSAQTELVYDAGSQSAENALGGVRMDSIPKEGGNRVLRRRAAPSTRTDRCRATTSRRELRQFIRVSDHARLQLRQPTPCSAARFGRTGSGSSWRIQPVADQQLLRADASSRTRRRAGAPSAASSLPHATVRLTTQLTPRNKLVCAYYNSQARHQRYDVGCTATSGNSVACTSPEASYALPSRCSTPARRSGPRR